MPTSRLHDSPRHNPPALVPTPEPGWAGRNAQKIRCGREFYPDSCALPHPKALETALRIREMRQEHEIAPTSCQRSFNGYGAQPQRRFSDPLKRVRTAFNIQSDEFAA